MNISQDARDKLMEIKDKFLSNATDFGNPDRERDGWEKACQILHHFLSTAQVDDWQEMGSAPKDGTWFLAGFYFLNPDPVFDYSTACWDADCEFFADGRYEDVEESYIRRPFTHWRPPPAPPATKEVLG